MKLPKTTTIGGRIQYLRVLRGLTQFDLAMCLPVPIHEMTVSSWERGESQPRPTRLAQLAEALKTTVPWLATGRGVKPT
jgi:transcriptional regulator with XRE-family HTH domain